MWKKIRAAPFCRSTQFCSSIFPNSVLLKKNCWIWTIVRVASNPISMQDFFFVKIGAPHFAALFDLKRRNCNFIITVEIVLQLNSFRSLHLAFLWHSKLPMPGAANTIYFFKYIKIHFVRFWREMGKHLTLLSFSKKNK